MLGYYLPGRIVSSIGHVNPEVMQYLPYRMEELSGNNAIPGRMVKGINPDYVISLEIFVRNSLSRDPWFLANYHVLYRYDSEMFGSDGLYVFQRN